jgi:Flp pilus assembly protein TadD
MAALVAATSGSGPAGAQGTPRGGSVQASSHVGTIAGTILASNGKPWPSVVISYYDMTSNFNPANPTEIRIPPRMTVRTAEDGRYKVELPAGTYIMKVMKGEQVLCQIKVPVYSGVETPGDMNFKTFLTSYADVVNRFETGDKALVEVNRIRDQINKLQTDLEAAGMRATAEYRHGLNSAEEDNFYSRFFLLAKLGETYDAMGAYATAAESYQQALELKPDAIAYGDLSNDLAKSGRFDEAAAACEKSAQLNPATAPQAYMNLAINFYNVGRFEAAVVPARKSTELDPTSAKEWYVLGAALAGAVQFKQQGDKYVADIPPGTMEAFQKTISMDSKGTWGKLAQEGVDQLHRMQAGIATKELAVPIKQ